MSVLAGEEAPTGATALWRWLCRQLLAERERWTLWLAPAFGLGVALYFSLPGMPPFWGPLAALAAVVGLAVALRRRPAVWPLALAAAALALGFAVTDWRLRDVAAPVLRAEVGPVKVVGQVLEVEARPRGERVLLAPSRIGKLPPDRLPERIRVSVTAGGGTLAPGNWVELTAKLRPPPGPAAPGAYDFARRAYFERLGAIGFAYGAPRVLAAGERGEAGPWQRARLRLTDLRVRIAGRIRAALPGQPGEVAAALMVGERGAIAETVLERMRDSGLAHLLAISGLHLGLVSGTIFFGLRFVFALWPWVALTFPVKKWAAVAAACGALAYLLLSGATVPTQRAFLMVLPVFAAILLDRSAVSMRLVVWAAVAILALAPESLLSASFQLSFAAVTALIAGYEALRKVRQTRLVPPAAENRRMFRVFLYFGGVLLSSILANVATAPFALQAFGQIALYGLLANMIAIPLTAFWIMPGALLASLAMPFGLEGWPLAVMGRGIEILLWLAGTVAAWPRATLLFEGFSTPAFALIVAGGLWLCLWQRPWRLAGAVVIVAAPLVFPLPPGPDLLIGGDGRLRAVRSPAGELVLSSRRSGFVAEQWLRRNAQKEMLIWPGAGQEGAPWLRCDTLGCLYRREGWRVALVDTPAAFAEDCRRADVVVAAIPAPAACRRAGAKTVIDLGRLREQGAHAVRLLPGRIEIESANAVRGDWPWVAPRRADGGE